MALECFNAHHRLLAFRAKMVLFPRVHILECSSIHSLHSFQPTILTPSWLPQRSLANLFLKPVGALIIPVPPRWAHPSAPSFPGGLTSTYSCLLPSTLLQGTVTGPWGNEGLPTQHSDEFPPPFSRALSPSPSFFSHTE